MKVVTPSKVLPWTASEVTLGAGGGLVWSLALLTGTRQQHLALVL